MKIAVGTKNPAKLQAVTLAFEKMGYNATITGVNVPSDVSDQPFSDDETVRGAINRATAALAAGAYDFGIGLEGGVVDTKYGMMLSNWCAIVSPQEPVSLGGGVRMLLPETIAAEVRQGRELGHVIDDWAGRHDVAKGEGTIGILTHGHITRSAMFRDAVICAFSPFALRGDNA
ncbi:inosine/xanthosine triphosphatase [Alicyclobacillus dauci]|uniref:Probable inosine/xanthosine triphosphatase n=1 Tax=Alicyclobacillus dauci TaxID=1475485 RepID=A0ABY6YYG6_9BACL|nr:inosine/xanthosine triphosphatase [Alicyclobacillus dauci]WAH35166.1 inosine/xanthosine triphosphatase [Alicyclobacillus dauci]